MRVSNAKATNARASSTSVDSTSVSSTSVSSTSVSSMKVSKASRADLAGRHAVALGLAIASLAASERAAAECAPQSPVNNATVTCTGTTRNQNSPDGYGTTNDTGNTINVQSGASVTGDRSGLIFGAGTVNNSGTISGGGFGIVSVDSAIVTNSGTISAGANGRGIAVQNSATVTNSGMISVGTNGFGIFTDTATVNNSGTISVGTDGFGILAGTATVTNSGMISAGVNGTGIFASTTATVTNSGTISVGVNGFGIRADAAATVTNFGTISAGAGGIGILSFGTATVTNSGTISGGTAIDARDASTIANAGAIIGLDGGAILLGTGADRLTLLPGSHILGAIDMGGGNDVVSFSSAKGIAQLITLQNFTGTINIVGSPAAVHNATQIASLDPTAFALADRSLLDFTGGISALVQGRLAGADANGRPSTGALAVGYAPDDRKLIGKAPPAAYAAPYVVWTEGFGGTRTQKATDELLRATSTAWGGVIGVDRQVRGDLRGDLLFGAFVGGGTGRLSVDQGSQRIDTDHVVGGVYGRFDWVSQFFDFKLQAGGSDNKSTRQVFSNLAPNGLENASAHYGGWFISPELGYGLRYGLGNGYTLTPLARVRYVAGVLDGYSETGSGQGPSVGRRTLQNVEERGEIELARTSQFGLTDTIRTYMHGGVIALQRVGDTNVNTTLIGQSFIFATPGKDSATGAVAGAGFDLTVGGRFSVFGAVEGTLMSDKSRTGMAKGGMRVAF
jgi:autotransporter-like protein